ncbi:MAG: hypothetical protein LBI12_05125, partial [Treponema sp.]|nr:hypothetical protein [Treponema sp.]
MQLHKTSGIPAGKPELLSKNTHPMAVKESSGATKSAKASAALPKTFVSSLIAAAGLPADKLSSSIVSFVRFFSLPIKKEVLLDIRRQVFAHPTAQTAEERTTLSMAAAAAESKGVELHQKGLELYAEAVDPKWRERQNSGGQNKQHNNRQNQQNDDNILSKSGSINSSNLEKIALEDAEKDPLLSILNRLPGKNGQRWIVLPFEFNEKNRQFRMSLRILLEEKKQ